MNTATDYFMTDALGSARQLTNGQGQVTLANAYEPYGVLAQTAGSAQTSYGFTGELADPSGMVYLRARYYSPNDGRFLTRDTWMGEYNRPMSLNRWMYVEGNPINRRDPSGLFPDTVIWKNIPIADFTSVEPNSYPLSRERWGFYALLLDAQEYEYVRVGFLDLTRIPYPVISYTKATMIWTINCETIMIGSQTLRQYYETEVKQQRRAGIWWRDTSAKYYQLLDFPTPDRIYVDGSYRYESDYPHFHSISLGLGAVEFNIIVDANGYFHLSLPSPRSKGKIFGVGYTESYLCGWNDLCYNAPAPSEITRAIDGICVSGGLVLIGGISIAPICWSPIDPRSVSAVSTYYIGLEAGYSGGCSITIPLSPWPIPPNPKLGWSEAIYQELNGITFADILSRWK